MRLFSEQIRAFVPRRYVTLGTDGFSRPTPARVAQVLRGRPPLVTVAALKALADEGTIERSKVAEAIAVTASIRPPNPRLI